MMPGITHSFERSITAVSFGMSTFAPTATIFLSLTRMTWFLATVPLEGSIRFPARIATVCPQAGTATSKHTLSSHIRMFPFSSCLRKRQESNTRGSREPVMPDPCGANQVRIISQGSQHQFRFISGHEPAPTLNERANAIHEQRSALHHAAAQHDRIGSKQINEIRQSQPQIERLVLNGLLSHQIFLLRQFTDTLRRNAGTVRVTRRRMPINPRDHSGPSRQRLPASAESAGALRPRRIDHLVTDFGMRSIDPAIELAVDDNSAADPRAHRDVDQPLAILPCAPSRLRQGSGVRIILESHLYVEHRGQILDRTLPSPSGQKIDVAKFPAHGIHRPCRSDSNARNLRPGSLRRPAQHVRDEFE